jgi:hypothetical protein
MKTRNIMWLLVLTGRLVPGLTPAAYGGQTILIDFGNASSWRGVTVPKPDINGNYWNSVWSGAFYPDLIDINGNATTIDFGFSVGGAGGTDSYNGPAGVTTSPVTPSQIAAADIDAAALGNLGIKEAAIDFYTSSRFEIQGLDPAKTYNLTFFGSHKYSPDMTTVYSVCTDNTFSTVVASAALDVVAAPDGSVGADQHNRDKVAVINDIDPQASNILWIKFVGSDGHDGYLNCLQIEEAPGVKAKLPDPRDGEKLVPLTTKLKWSAPSDYAPAKYVLRFRAGDSPDPNWIVVDPVVDLNLDGDPATTEAAPPMALDYDTTYDWKVTSFKLNDPNQFEGPVWSFTTEPELLVEAGPNILTWLEEGGAMVDLNGSVTCQCTLSRLLWSVVEKPAGATVYIADDSSADTWASFDTTGTYILKLWAQDDNIPPFQNEDTVEIQVFADACLAAKANPAGYTPLAHDINGDCREDLDDFADFAADWLMDLSLTENLEY